MKKYTICHLILDKLLEIMIKNPRDISLKYEHYEIYNKLKEEML